MNDISEILKTLKERYPKLELQKGCTILSDEGGPYHEEFDVLSGEGLDFAFFGDKTPYKVCSKDISGIMSKHTILKDVAKKMTGGTEAYFVEFSSKYIPNICEGTYAGYVSPVDSVDAAEKGIASVTGYAKEIENIYESEIGRLLKLKMG